MKRKMDELDEMRQLQKRPYISCAYPAAEGDPAYPVLKMFITRYAGSPSAAG